MLEAFAILFMAAGVAFAVWWAVTGDARRPAGFAVGALAVGAGAVLLLRAEIVRFSVDELEAIEAAARRATADAGAIRDVRASIEAEARAESGRVAAQRAEAKRLAAEMSAAVAQIEKGASAARAQATRRDPALAPLERASARRPDAAGPPSTQQLEIVATALRSSGAHELRLTTSTDDTEAIELAIRLKQAIEAGGWTVHLTQAELPTVSGVQVRTPVPLPPHVTTLLGALGRAGLHPNGLAQPDGDELEVLVGSRAGSS
jgi:hypothetical protein